MKLSAKTFRILGRFFLVSGAVLGLWSIYNIGRMNDSMNAAAPISSFLIAIGVFFTIMSKKKEQDIKK